MTLHREQEHLQVEREREMLVVLCEILLKPTLAYLSN